MTICPCCGFKFVGALSNGCRQCGARAVGEPLPKPAHELPSYGRALLLAVGGSLTVLVFVTQLIIGMFQKKSTSFGFWTWVAAGETAAWRLKWIAIPLFIVTAWLGRKLYRSIKFQPERFCGVKYARRGLVASTVVVMLVAFLIVITVPARLENRRLAQEAGIRANWHTFERALLEYRSLYKTYPADLKDLRERIPDPDGSIAAALATLDPNGYHPSSADVAAVASEKSRRLRGAVIRNASVSSAGDDMPSGTLAYTTYELRLPGEDKILGTEDDWIGSNGILKRYSDSAKGGVGRSVSAGILQP